MSRLRITLPVVAAALALLLWCLFDRCVQPSSPRVGPNDGVPVEPADPLRGDANAALRRPSPFIAGSVVDRRSGQAISGASVRAASQRATTTPEGEFHIDDVGAGEAEVDLEVASDGYADQMLRAPVGAASRVEMERSRGLSVRVIERGTGAPLRAFRVRVLPYLDENVSAARRARRKEVEQAANERSSGWVWFADVAPGSYLVWIASEDSTHVPPIPTVFSWSEGHGEVVVEVDLAARLVVTVLDATGVAAARSHHVRVAVADDTQRLAGDYGEHQLVTGSRYAWAYPVERPPIVLAEGDSVRGKVELACPRSATFAVLVSSGDVLIRTVVCEMLDAAERELTVTLPPCIELSGTIGPADSLHEIHPGWPEYWLDSGRPEHEKGLPSFVPTVVAVAADRAPEDGGSWVASIDVDGSFHFDHLPLGKWSLHLSYHVPETATSISHRISVLGAFEWWRAQHVRETLDVTGLVPARIRFLCQGDGGPLEGARVQVASSGSTKEIATGVTDASGAVRLRVAPGRYAVCCFAAKTRRRAQAAMTVVAGDADYEIDLRSSDVVIEATHPNGDKLQPELRARLKAPEIGWSSPVVQSDSGGTVRFVGVPHQLGDSILEIEFDREWKPHRIEASRFAASAVPRVVPVTLSR